MALRNQGHRHGVGFIGSTPLPPLQPPTHRMFSPDPSTFDPHIFLCQRHSDRSTDRPLKLQRLGIGTPSNEDANAPLTPTTAQPSKDGGRRCGVPKVFGFGGILVGERIGTTEPHIKQHSRALHSILTQHHTMSKGGKQQHPTLCLQGCDDPIGSPQ